MHAVDAILLHLLSNASSKMETFPIIENACKLLQQKVSNADSTEAARFLVGQTTECSEGNLIFIGKKSGTLHDWISQINTSLNTSSARLEGLVLLRAVICQCSSETFSECCLTWVRLLVSIFQPHQSPHIVEVTAGILVEILREASQIPEIARDLAVNHIPGLLGTLLNADKEWTAPSLRLLSVCMHRFPGPCGAINYKLEALIISHLHADNPHVQELSQQCYPLLARLGGGGAGGVKYGEAFKYHIKKITDTISHQLGVLYADQLMESHHGGGASGELLPLPNLAAEEPSRTFQLTSQIETLNACLQNMLREDFPAQAVIPVKAILEFICDALEVTSRTLGDHITAESSVLALVIPRIHRTVMQSLTALIGSCCMNHYNEQINQLYLKTLGWTQSHHSVDAQVQLFSNLRCETYHSIVTWLKTAGVASGLAGQAGAKLVHWCIQDASLPTGATKLASAMQTKRDKGGKQKVKGQAMAGDELSGRQRVNFNVGESLCLAALKALRHLIIMCGIKLKANLHHQIIEFVIALLRRLQTSAPTDLPPPYTAPDCRTQLYKVLLAAVLVPHPQASSPLQLAVGIFEKGKMEGNLKVSSTCTEASVICGAIIHPRRPPQPHRGSTTPQTFAFQAATTPISKADSRREDTISTPNVSASQTEPVLQSPARNELKITHQPSWSSPRASAPQEVSSLDDLPGETRSVTGGVENVPQVEQCPKFPKLESTMEEEEEKGEKTEQDEEGVETAEPDSEPEEVYRSTRKRKYPAAAIPKAKKPASKETVSMLEAFVDAPPDPE